MLWQIFLVLVLFAVVSVIGQAPDVRAFCTSVLTNPASPCEVAQCQGRAGKRGPQGRQGEPGQRGEKGARGPGTEDLKRSLSSLEEKVERNEKMSALSFCSLGMKNGKISDASVSTSSSSGRTTGKHWVRLDQQPISGSSSGSWCADTNDRDKWIKIDLGRMREVSGVVTQGSPSINSWTTSYTISCGDSNGKFTDLAEFGSIKAFKANSDRNTKAVNFFAEKITCRYVRIHPKTWNEGACMRIEILRGMCSNPKQYSFYVESAGADDGNTCKVLINGVGHAINTRGHCVVIFKPTANDNNITARTFDTYRTENQTNAMVSFIEQVHEYSIISVAVRDATKPAYVTDQASSLLQSLGAVGTACNTKPAVRDSWAFITQKVGPHDPRPSWVNCQHVLRYNGKATVHASVSTSAHYSTLEESPIG